MHADGADVAPSLPAAIARVHMPAPAFCIGGSELFALALPDAEVLHLTEIDRDFAGDVHFPAFDRAAWRAIEREPGRSADGIDFTFVTYTRVVGLPDGRGIR